MARIIFLVGLMVCGLHGMAQDSLGGFRLERSFAGQFSDFTVDDVGNIYLVLNQSQLKKLDKQGDSVAVFNEVRRYGKIHSVDVSNPFRVLVFYRNTSTVLILDRFLSIRQVIDLRKSNILQAKAVQLSYDNHIWVFDELDSKIKKIDDNGRLLMQSVDLRNVFATVPSFENIFDQDRSLFLYDPQLGWFAFDYYGAFTRKYAFTGWKDVQVVNNLLIGRTGNTVLTARANDFMYSEQTSPISFAMARKVLHRPRQLFVLLPDALERYQSHQ